MTESSSCATTAEVRRKRLAAFEPPSPLFVSPSVKLGVPDDESPFQQHVKWMQSISDSNVERQLQQTPEYENFVQAVEQLKSALHRSSTTDMTIETDTSGSRLVVQNHHHSTLELDATFHDDSIWMERILPYLICYDLVQLSMTSRRYYRLIVYQYVPEKVRSISRRRQLSNPLQLFRAQEQIMGISTPPPRLAAAAVAVPPTVVVVPIPTLLLPHCVLVTQAGDRDYNGIYYCTGCNGNGYEFSRPWSEPLPLSTTRTTSTGQQQQQQADDDMWDDEVDETSSLQPRPGQRLRCIITKRFSHENLLWYMSKEIVETTGFGATVRNIVVQEFHYWAKLMMIDDAPVDKCQYPSQTSRLLRTGPGWQSLITDDDDHEQHLAQPPVVELLE